MNFMESVKTCFQKYFVFSGRARRSEFWWWILFTTIASVVFSLIDLMLFGALAAQGAGPISTVFSLATFIPTIAVSARRLHDIDKSGWWQLAWIVPMFVTAFAGALMAASGAAGLTAILVGIGVLATIGALILLIVWFATDGQRHDNRFGYSPKYGGQVSAFD